MQAHGRTTGFVRTEGGLLPPDLLERVRALDGKLPGLDEVSYGLARNERFGEAITRSWNRLVGAWTAFSDELAKVPETDPTTTLTRERFLLPLFEELGYGRLSPAKAVELDGKSYPISHFYETVPLHLVGANVPLDRRSRGVAGAAGQSPHGLLQELLNRSPERLWGIVSNGRSLRVLRDNASLTRQAYLEFDLEAMFASEAYADFALLWHVAHRTRLEARPADGAEAEPAASAEACYLERWSKEAADAGARARDRLRDGVQEAIEALGSGFLAHPANGELRAALQTGELSTQDYYRELLRLVYRLILLFVAEDRDLLLDPAAAPETRERYTRYYSTARLRRLAERRRGSRHADLYAGLRIVIAALGSDDGAPGIGLPPLGGFLFGSEACPHLDRAELANADLLEAVRKLATIEDRGVLRVVDYRNLGSEELGSIYESLLELHPELDVAAPSFALRTAAGHERKTTGSYYTPTALISVLLDSALDPVLAEAANHPTTEAAERAILELAIVDPAAGSGHFLVAAAHRIAKRLAQIRTGDEEPAPGPIRTALRDVIGHCLYAVDVNPMAVELCKVSLWLEALEPGKPLTFLDAHIKCGNSIVGVTPELLAQGIPNAAYDPIEGDDSRIARSQRDANSRERAGQLGFAEIGTAFDLDRFARQLRSLDSIAEESLTDVERKADSYRQLIETAEFTHQRAASDGWCAAFFSLKIPLVPGVTSSSLRAVAGGTASQILLGEIADTLRETPPFHWALEFPAVMARGGFDVVLGNPPWDALSPDAKEFFSVYDPAVRNASPAAQKAVIESLLGNPDTKAAWDAYCWRLYRLANFLRKSGRYRLFAPGNLGKGDFNTYRIFVELALQLTKPGGRVAQVVPDGFYLGANASAIRLELLESFSWEHLFGFENRREAWFRGIDSRTKFCIYSARKGGSTRAIRVAFGLTSEGSLNRATGTGSVALSAEVLRQLSPATLAVPDITDLDSISLVELIDRAFPHFSDMVVGWPTRVYMRELDMGNDRDLFKEPGMGYPLYEGRMVDQFDHRAKAYVSGRGRTAVWRDLEFGDSTKAITPQWSVAFERLPPKVRSRVDSYRLGFCDVTSPTNERSLLAALLPRGVVCGDKVPTIVLDGGAPADYMVWLAAANSLVIDYVVRRKVSLKMSYTVLDSLPIPRRLSHDTVHRQIVEGAARLTCTTPEMLHFWDELAADEWVDARGNSLPGITDPDRRLSLRAKLDAMVAVHLFGLDTGQISLILGDFKALANRERRRYGEFRSSRLVLEQAQLEAGQRQAAR
jgi:hypothetical protein